MKLALPLILAMLTSCVETEPVTEVEATTTTTTTTRSTDPYTGTVTQRETTTTNY